MLDAVAGGGNEPFSPRAVFLLAVVVFAAAAVTLRPVIEPPRGRVAGSSGRGRLTVTRPRRRRPA